MKARTVYDTFLHIHFNFVVVKEDTFRDFACGPVVESHTHARDMSSIPGEGTKTPHTTVATKPVHHNERSCHN